MDSILKGKGKEGMRLKLVNDSLSFELSS
jgi:hypothetical protein